MCLCVSFFSERFFFFVLCILNVLSFIYYIVLHALGYYVNWVLNCIIYLCCLYRSLQLRVFNSLSNFFNFEAKVWKWMLSNNYIQYFKCSFFFLNISKRYILYYYRKFIYFLLLRCWKNLFSKNIFHDIVTLFSLYDKKKCFTECIVFFCKKLFDL